MEDLKKYPVDSKFRFVLLAAARAEQLMEGARPKLEPQSRKMARVAMNEVLSGTVNWGYGPPPEAEMEEGFEELGEDGAGAFE